MTVPLAEIHEGLEEEPEVPGRSRGFRRSVYESLAWIHFQDSQEEVSRS